MQPSQDTRLAPVLLTLTFARLIFNGARRFPYAILTPMALALGRPRSTLEAALSLLWATGALGPLGGILNERIGRKPTMLLGVGCLAVFAGLAAANQGADVVLFAIIAIGAARVLFDPAMQAYIGDRTPYSRRGMALGFTELSWSGALFVFGPLAAFLIVQGSLGLIYGVIAAASVLAFVLILRVVPGDGNQQSVAGPANGNRRPVRDLYRLLFASPPAMSVLLAGFLLDTMAQSMGIVYEAWLRDAFALTTLVLGTVALLFSVAEFSGEGVVIVASDRFGKRRLALLAMLATGCVCFAIPFAGNSIVAVVLLFLMFLFFEISVVVLLTLATEVLPQARGTVMSSTTTAFAAGNALGVLLGGWMFRAGGMHLNGTVALALSLSAALVIWRYVTDDGSESVVDQPEVR